jgi:hypothetical protein
VRSHEGGDATFAGPKKEMRRSRYNVDCASANRTGRGQRLIALTSWHKATDDAVT